MLNMLSTKRITISYCQYEEGETEKTDKYMIEWSPTYLTSLLAAPLCVMKPAHCSCVSCSVALRCVVYPSPLSSPISPFLLPLPSPISHLPSPFLSLTLFSMLAGSYITMDDNHALEHIFTFLSVSEALVAERVSKHWYTLTSFFIC